MKEAKLQTCSIDFEKVKVRIILKWAETSYEPQASDNIFYACEIKM